MDAHLQGLRVIDGDEERPDERLLVVMMQKGADHQGRVGVIPTDPFAVDTVNAQVMHRFAHYFTAVLARGLQLGIPLDTMSAVLTKFGRTVGSSPITPAMSVVGFDVDDVFETLFEYPDEEPRKFLRVVEDDYSEVLTADQLRELIDERQR